MIKKALDLHPDYLVNWKRSKIGLVGDYKINKKKFVFTC